MGLLNRAQEIVGAKTFKHDVKMERHLYVRGGEVHAKEQSYTPTFTNFGTCTGITFSWVRAGNKIKVIGKFTSGTTVGGEARISLPSSLVSDSALVPSIMICGTFARSAASATAYYCLIESGAAYITFGGQNVGVGALTKANGNGILGNSEAASVQFELPISGWNG